MTRILCVLLGLCTILQSYAQTSKTINLTTAGSLSTMLTVTEKSFVTDLLVTGLVNNSDFETMNADMPNLANIDLSGASCDGDSVPFHAFYGKMSLVSVILPSTITKISGGAFNCCKNLTTINFPTNLRKIGYGAFSICKKLSSPLILPSGFLEIEDYAFHYCYSLPQVSIPASLTKIGFLAFSEDTSLQTIEVDDCNTNYADVGGVLFNKSVTSLICYPAQKAASSFEIPGTVTKIYDYAFIYTQNLVTLNIPASVNYIGDEAFRYGKKLESISVNGSNANFASDNGVLFNKDKTTLKYCPGAKSGVYTVPSTVNTIETKAFYGCSKLTRVDISGTYVFIWDEAFGNCTSLTSISLSEGSFTRYGTFMGCTSLKKALLPSSLTTLSGNDFYGCTSLDTIELPASMKYIGGLAFAECNHLKKVIFNSKLLSIGSGAFQNCSSLDSVVVPSTLTEIGDAAFEGCSGLRYVWLPGSLSQIGSSAFRECQSLKSVNLPINLKEIDPRIFQDCLSLEKVTIPSGIDTMYMFSFNGCSGLDNIKLFSVTPTQLSPDFSYFDSVDQSTCVLYVPAGSASAYAAAVQWKDFLHIVEYGYKMSVNNTDIQVPYIQNTTAIDITSSTEWQVSCDKTWITILNSVGSDNDLVRLAVGVNNNHTDRSATITIKGTGVSDISINLHQEGYPVTATENLTRLNMAVYPTPVINSLYVDNAEGLSYTVYNLQGITVQSGKLKSNHETLDMSSVPSGIYILKAGVNNFKILK
jgi:hypothetical protein